MTPINYILGGFSALAAVALYFSGMAYLGERDTRVELEFTQRLNEEKLRWGEAKEAEIAAIRTSYTSLIDANETTNQEKINDLTTQLMSAQEDATRAPIKFGDDLVRQLIYTDCMWSLPHDSVQGRAACSREAVNADPSSTNLHYTALTPSYLASWADACDDYRTLGTSHGAETYTVKEWREDYNNFSPEMCEETLVALTAPASKFLELFVNKGTDYITRLRTYGLEQADIIEQLTSRQKKAQNN